MARGVRRERGQTHAVGTRQAFRQTQRDHPCERSAPASPHKAVHPCHLLLMRLRLLPQHHMPSCCSTKLSDSTGQGSEKSVPAAGSSPSPPPAHPPSSSRRSSWPRQTGSGGSSPRRARCSRVSEAAVGESGSSAAVAGEAAAAAVQQQCSSSSSGSRRSSSA